MDELLEVFQIIQSGATLPGFAALFYILWQIDRRLVRVETILNGKEKEDA